jgi:hypothetical protein
MSGNFDYEEFDKKIHQEYDAYKMNLKQTDSKKETALLHTNYFQDCLKDSMESVLHSKEARRIPVKIIVSILKDREILSPIKANDAVKICNIRDWFAHRVNVKSIEEDAEELICTIDIQFLGEKDTTRVKENTDIMVRANKGRENFDLYERLDLICFDLSKIARNEALHHDDRPKTKDAT